MKLVSFSCAATAFDHVLDFFENDQSGVKVVVTNADEITDRDFASGLVSPNAGHIWCAENGAVMLAMCEALALREVYSPDVQVVIQREIGKDYVTPLYFKNMDEDDLALFVVAPSTLTA